MPASSTVIPQIQENVTYEQTAFLDEKSVKQHRIIGQVFDTYWLVEFDEKLYIIDQHAAHEKVLFERTMKQLADKEYTTQRVSPPVILTLSLLEEETLKKFLPQFEKMGYEIEHFGGNEYAVSGVPGKYVPAGCKSADDTDAGRAGALTGKRRAGYDPGTGGVHVLQGGCQGERSSVLSGSRASDRRAFDTGESLQLSAWKTNAIIAMTKYELEKKFKRIV